MSKRVVIGCLAIMFACSSGEGVAEPVTDADHTPPAAPTLRLEDLQGQSHSLDGFRGKVVLINFWASWCGPCIEEIPSLRELYRRMAGEPFEILAVNVKEGRFKVHKFSRLVEMPFPILLDPDGEAFAAWDAQVLPTSFLIDSQGRVREEIHGRLDWAPDEVVETIRALLPAPAATLTAVPPDRGRIATSGSPGD